MNTFLRIKLPFFFQNLQNIWNKWASGWNGVKKALSFHGLELDRLSLDVAMLHVLAKLEARLQGIDRREGWRGSCPSVSNRWDGNANWKLNCCSIVSRHFLLSQLLGKETHTETFHFASNVLSRVEQRELYLFSFKATRPAHRCSVHDCDEEDCSTEWKNIHWVSWQTVVQRLDPAEFLFVDLVIKRLFKHSLNANRSAARTLHRAENLKEMWNVL